VASARRRSGTRIGSRRFKAKAGQELTVRVRLSKRGRQRILRGRGKRRRGRITVTTRGADGKAQITTQSITLRAERRRPTRGRKR
jgi:hypothetical protein